MSLKVSQSVFGVLFCVLTVVVLSQSASIQPRSENTTLDVKICHKTTPCEWAVYIPFTRRIDYVMKNTCECPPDKKCTRTDDDLSVSAYVYRCVEVEKKTV